MPRAGCCDQRGSNVHVSADRRCPQGHGPEHLTGRHEAGSWIAPGPALRPRFPHCSGVSGYGSLGRLRQGNTTTLSGFAAVAREGFPTLELPTEATLIVGDPPAGQVGAEVMALYSHEADVMEQSPVWRRQLRDAGFAQGFVLVLTANEGS